MSGRAKRQKQETAPRQACVSCLGPGIVAQRGSSVSVLFIELALGLYPRFEARAASAEEAREQAERLRVALEASADGYQATFEGVKAFLIEHGRPLRWIFKNEEFGSNVSPSAIDDTKPFRDREAKDVPGSR